MELANKDILIENFKSSLPMDWEDLDGHSWEGFSANEEDGIILAQITPCLLNNGFMNYSVIGRYSKSESKKPVHPIIIGAALDNMISHFSKTQNCASLKWKNEIYVPTKQMPINKKTIEKIYGEIVYFISAGEFIKIGKATGDPHSRISSFRTGCPYPIHLLGYVKGGLEKEFEFHKIFAKYRAHGEWFYNMGELKDFIENEIIK